MVISSDSKSAIGRVLCGAAETGAIFTTSGKAGGDAEFLLAAITPAKAADKIKALAKVDTTTRLLRKKRFFLVDMKVSPGESNLG